MKKRAYYAAGAAWAHCQRRRPVGTNIFTADWDVCIVLDSCRYDLLDRWFIGHDVDSRWSVGSVTTEWLATTFHTQYREQIMDTAYVGANPHSATVFHDRDWLRNQNQFWPSYPAVPCVEPASFDGYYELWRSHATNCNAVPPATMRDGTLAAHDRHDRVVAHWLQPHEPFFGEFVDTELAGMSGRIWDGLNAGTLDADRVWAAYRDTLRSTLPFVRETIAGIDGRVLVTADHGNAFGEWGIYGHPFGWPQPAVRRVPWVLIDGCGKDVEYDAVLESDATESDVEEQLRALGYR